MKNTLVISAFPGLGKSHVTKSLKDTRWVVLDSDSSLFSWIYDENGNKTNERDPNFPDNYMTHIKENIGVVDVIFVSSHKIVRDALCKNNINHFVIYPDISMKDEMINRYIERGNDEHFINFLTANYESFVKEIEDSDEINKIKLGGGIISKYCDSHTISIPNQKFITINLLDSLYNCILNRDKKYEDRLTVRGLYIDNIDKYIKRRIK